MIEVDCELESVAVVDWEDGVAVVAEVDLDEDSEEGMVLVFVIEPVE